MCWRRAGPARRVAVSRGPGIERRAPLDSVLEFFQVFLQPRLAPREVPGVEHEDQPKKAVSQNQENVSHSTPS